MKEMSKDEKIMYDILKNSSLARKNNWEAMRMFYLNYGIELPSLQGKPNFWTVERSVRMLKTTYNECTDKESDEIKDLQEDIYKEAVLDKNRPLKPSLVKSEEVKLSGEGIWW